MRQTRFLSVARVYFAVDVIPPPGERKWHLVGLNSGPRLTADELFGNLDREAGEGFCKMKRVVGGRSMGERGGVIGRK